SSLVFGDVFAEVRLQLSARDRALRPRSFDLGFAGSPRSFELGLAGRGRARRENSRRALRGRRIVRGSVGRKGLRPDVEARQRRRSDALARQGQRELPLIFAPSAYG